MGVMYPPGPSWGPGGGYGDPWGGSMPPKGKGSWGPAPAWSMGKGGCYPQQMYDPQPYMYNKGPPMMMGKGKKGHYDGADAAAGAAQGDRRCDLFIGKLPESVTREVLIDFFNQQDFPVIEPLVKVPMAQGVPRGYAFVTLKNPKHTDRAIKQLSGKQLHGRRITVERSTDPVSTASGSSAKPGGSEFLGARSFELADEVEIHQVRAAQVDRPVRLLLTGMDYYVKRDAIQQSLLNVLDTSAESIKVMYPHEEQGQGSIAFVKCERMGELVLQLLATKAAHEQEELGKELAKKLVDEGLQVKAVRTVGGIGA